MAAPSVPPETSRPTASASAPTPARVDPAPAPARSQSTPIPIELVRDVAILLDASHASEREAAGRRLREMNLDGAPAFVPHVITLELASGCRERRDAVRALGEIADSRALAALERIERARRGCGLFGAQDCHRCLRRDLRATIATLRGNRDESP